MLALGLALLFPLALSLLYRDGSWASFLAPAAFMVSLEAAGLQASREPLSSSPATSALLAIWVRPKGLL